MTDPAPAPDFPPDTRLTVLAAYASPAVLIPAAWLVTGFVPVPTEGFMLLVCGGVFLPGVGLLARMPGGVPARAAAVVRYLVVAPVATAVVASAYCAAHPAPQTATFKALGTHIKPPCDGFPPGPLNLTRRQVLPCPRGRHVAGPREGVAWASGR